MFKNKIVLLALFLGSIESANDFLQASHAEQLRFDAENPHLAPDLNTMTENTRSGKFTLKTLIHIGEYSAVFTVHETRKFIVKYSTNCQDLNAFNPVTIDTWFTWLANQLNIAPAIYELSPPSSFPAHRTEKIPFSMSDEKWKACHEAGADVRYMMSRRLEGESVNSYTIRQPLSVMNFDNAMSVLYQTIELIKRLHASNIVHGDIHAGNVVLARQPDSTEIRLYLIDFANAFFQDEIFSNDPVYGLDEWTHPLTTPWQILGLNWGKRDDIYRALDMFARLINGPEFEMFIEDLVKSGYQDLITWRLNDSLFEISPNSPRAGRNPFDHAQLNVSPETAEYIRDIFERILDIVRGLSDINQPIPYEEIQSLIENAQDAYKAGVNANTTTIVPSVES